MTDHDALLAAILAYPADDTPRLVYADWLAENAGMVECGACKGSGYRGPTTADILPKFIEQVGRDGMITRFIKPEPFDYRLPKCPTCSGTGQVSDGRRERAEFIRVQVELARIESAGSPLEVGKDARENAFRLHRRERELLESESRNWLAWSGPAASIIPNGARFDWHVTFTRGFVSSLTCSWADWLAHHEAIYWHPEQKRPFVAAAQPIERARLTTWPEAYPCPTAIDPHSRIARDERWPRIEFELPEPEAGQEHVVEEMYTLHVPNPRRHFVLR